jgi:hypothetical protein
MENTVFVCPVKTEVVVVESAAETPSSSTSILVICSHYDPFTKQDLTRFYQSVISSGRQCSVWGQCAPQLMSSLPGGCWRNLQQIHPDVLRSPNLLLTLNDIVDCTKLGDWKMPVGPVVGNMVDDSKQFESFGGTSACFCDWLSDSANLYVTDLRLTFNSEASCKNYHNQALSSNAEVSLPGNITQMVELEIQSQESPNLSHVGSSCHVFCGPTPEARSYLASTFAAKESTIGPETITKRVEKAMHLVYLFHVDRVVCKLCVTSFNGLIPFGYAFELAKGCFNRVKKCQSVVHNTWIKSKDKANLREILKRRALERMADDVKDSVVSPEQQDTHQVLGKKKVSIEPGGKELYFKLNLFVAALGKGHLMQGPNGGSKNFERLEALCTKVPKDQVIPIDFPGSGRAPLDHIDLKLRLFVSRSEDAKAVQGYISSHSKQRPAPFVVLFESLPVAVKYHESLHAGRRDLSPAIADRLRKQAKSRAVRFVRRILGEAARRLTVRELMGSRGANSITGLLAGMLPSHLTVLPSGGQKVLLLTSDEDPTTPAADKIRPEVKIEGTGRARRWAFDDVEGVDGLMALCQSPPASKIADWKADSEINTNGLALRSGRRRGMPEECTEENGEDGTVEAESQVIGAGKRHCRE